MQLCETCGTPFHWETWFQEATAFLHQNIERFCTDNTAQIIANTTSTRRTSFTTYTRRGARREGLRGIEPPPFNGNRLNTNLLLTFVKTQNNSAHAYIAIYGGAGGAVRVRSVRGGSRYDFWKTCKKNFPHAQTFSTAQNSIVNNWFMSSSTRCHGSTHPGFWSSPEQSCRGKSRAYVNQLDCIFVSQ